MTSTNTPHTGPQLPDDFEPYDPAESQQRHSHTEAESAGSATELQSAAVHESSQGGRRRGGVFREIVETALIAILIFVAVRSLVLNFRVDGSSMLPSLVDGEMLLVNRNAYDSFDLYTLIDWLPGVEHANAKEITPFDGPDRGDIVVFDPPESVNASKPYIKRVIGLPGETVEIRDGSVYIDGVTLEEDYIAEGITNCGQRECETWTIPEGHVFVLGDNRENSSDSRVFGPVEIDRIEGKAWVVYWPLDEVGRVDDAGYPDE